MKITLTRLLETSKLLSTEVGRQIPEFFNYMAELVEQMIRALRNGLKFQDNFDCEVKVVSLLHNTPQVITASKPATGVIPLRVISQNHMIDAFNMYFDQQGRLTIKVAFDSDPGSSLDVAIVLLF